MFITCIKIFFARIVDVTLGTIRTILVVKGNKLTPAIVAFFEVLIWFLVAREALSKPLDSWLIPIFYALGYATGTFIGGHISNKFIDSIISVQVIINEVKTKEIVKEIKKNGFGVSIIDLKNDNKDMLIIELNKSKLKDLTKIIRTIEPSAYLFINETKYVQNGVIK